MKRIAIAIAVLLFFFPFFWLKPGFVDLGGDGGRLYFIDPWSVLKNTWNLASSFVYSFADIGYLLALTLLKQFVQSPTLLIAIEHGLQLSLSFIGMYLIVKALLLNEKKNDDPLRASIVAIVTGVVYVGLITKVGWPVALVTLNQVFLNVIMFYFLLTYCLTRKFVYILAGLFLSIIFSANFGLGNMPQLLSFYPAALLFLFIYLRFIAQIEIPWKGLICGIGLFLGLHSFHLLPVMASLINSSSIINSQVFSKDTIQNSGVNYFAANHVGSGKISRELFQSWLGQNFWSFVVPGIAFLGFLRCRSKLLSLIGIFFAATLFLVAANITQIGVHLYQMLFYLPGFVMFRSFNEKWFFVYAFFYAILFAVSLYYLLEKKKLKITFIICATIFAISVYRLIPFLSGKAIQSIQYQSKNVSTIYSLDPDLLDAISYIRILADNGNVLTLPLTLPYYQVIYGKSGGAYVGISLVSSLGGKRDYSGLWSFGAYQADLERALKNGNNNQVLQMLSLLGVRYIFRDTDPRIINDFPTYPYYRFDRSVDIPAIDSQISYDQFLESYTLTTKFEKGFFRIQEFDDIVVRPTVYIPDIVSASFSGVLNGSSFRSAYGDAKLCQRIPCDELPNAPVPSVTYTKRSSVLFDVVVDIGERKTPFLVTFSHPYYSSWELSFDGVAASAVSDHIVVNGYANGWIVDPAKAGSKTVLHGRIYLKSQNYFYIGVILSAITLAVIFILLARELTKGRHEKKK